MEDWTTKLQIIKYFTNTFEIVFHKDWMYSSAMLSDETFIDGQTFIEGEWITNWINKDKLIETYFLLKKMLNKNNLDWSYMEGIIN